MKCEQVQPNLLDYGKGLLSAVETEEIRAHIDHCAECKALLEEELAFSAQLLALPDEQPVVDVWEIIQTRTRPKRLQPRAFLADIFATNIRKAVVATAAAAVLFATLYSNQPADEKLVVKQETKPAITVKWSDDPLGDHTDATLELIAKM